MIIAISGKKGAGKTTLAKNLQKKLSGNWEVVPLAQSLKALCSKAVGHHVLPDMTEEEKNQPTVLGCTHRELLQRVGTALRDVHPQFWVRVWESYAEGLARMYPQQGLNFIVDDVRYMNEYDYFAMKGAVLVRLKRNVLPPDDHPSETDLDTLLDVSFHVVVPENAHPMKARDLVLNHPDLRELVQE
jgi:DNA helicase HerA-like ATPase